MTCEAEEHALAEIRKLKRNAEQRVQRENASAESALLRSEAHIYDWRAVRLAEAMAHCWDKRCVQAEDALARCKERRKRRQSD